MPVEIRELTIKMKVTSIPLATPSSGFDKAVLSSLKREIIHECLEEIKNELSRLNKR